MCWSSLAVCDGFITLAIVAALEPTVNSLGVKLQKFCKKERVMLSARAFSNPTFFHLLRLRFVGFARPTATQANEFAHIFTSISRAALYRPCCRARCLAPTELSATADSGRAQRLDCPNRLPRPRLARPFQQRWLRQIRIQAPCAIVA